MQRTKSKILSILLSLVMLLSLLPTTALAASYPDAASVSVNGGKPFGLPGKLYFKNGDTNSFTGDAGDYNAAYDETTGTLTLKDYEGGQIALGGASQKDLTIKLLGDNTVTVNGYSGILVPANGSNITITADSGSNATLTINVTCDSDNGDATGIDNYYGAGASGDVTITGHADVKIKTTTKRGGYGIYAQNVAIEDHAKVTTTVNAPDNTGGGLVCGIFAKNNVTINTAGEITVDVSNVGTGEYVYSTGVNSQNTLTLTKVGKMTVKWNDNLGNSGFPLYPTTASFDSNAYVTNVDKSNKSNCIATYMPKGTTSTPITGELAVAITAPEKGKVPQSDIAATAQYTGSITWTPDVTGGKFVANTEYTANVTLTATDGYQFASDVNPTVTDATISGKSVTDGGKTLTFNAKFAATDSLPAASVTAAPTAKSGLKYDGSAQDLLGFVGTAANGTMQYSLDNSNWSAAIPKGTDAGDYTVYYMAKGDSTHSDSAVASISATIDPKDINDSTVTIGTIAEQSYTGGAITPNPEVKDGTKTLVKGTDYTVSCTNKYVGTAELTITGTGNYTGTKKASFTIVAANQNPSFNTPASLVKGGHRLDLRTLVRDAKGDMTFTISGGGTSTHAELGSDGYTLTSTGIPGTVNINVHIAAQNEGGDSAPEYNEFSQTDAITVNVINKTTDSSTMTVTQGSITYGETVSPSVTNKPDGTGEVSYTYEGRDGTSYNSTTAPTNVGKYTVKAKCESSTTIYTTAEVNFAIQPKSISDVTVTLDKTSLKYNGSAQTVTVTVKDGGTTLVEGTGYTVTGATSGTNVGSYTVTVSGNGNYTNSVDRTWKITEKDVTVTGITATNRAYAKDNLEVALTGGTLTGVIPSDTVTVDLTNAKGTMTDANVGNGKAVTVTGVVLGGADKGNYKLKAQPTGVTVNITKATARTLANIPVSQKYNVTTEQSKDIGTAGMPADAGTLTYTAGSSSVTTGTATVSSFTVDNTGMVKYTITGGADGAVINLPVTIKSTNYADSTVNVVITLTKPSSSGGYYYAPTAAVVPDMPMLYRGCTGDAVKTLQDKLNALGYNSGNVDGIFGAKTYAAVTAFQKANSLGVDGIVGKLTWGKLYGVSPAMPVETTTVVGRPMVSYGSRGDAVRKLQELLNALGYDCGSVDGIFGSKTKAAVLAFQKANGLGVDGIVGPLTWAKLG